jgi:hypothetical protein
MRDEHPEDIKRLYDQGYKRGKTIPYEQIKHEGAHDSQWYVRDLLTQ